MFSYSVFVLTAYLVGSIPFGLIFSHLFKLGDIRQIGSGNIGATNVLRTGNKKAAVLTLLMDGLKGFLAVWFSSKFSPFNEIGIYIAGLAAIMGHIWPVWLNFKGGKGVATALGVYLAWYPLLALSLIILWLLVAKIFRISSLSALVALSSAPVVAFILNLTGWGTPLLTKFSLAVALLVIYTHRSNIRRLIDGHEKTIKI